MSDARVIVLVCETMMTNRLKLPVAHDPKRVFKRACISSAVRFIERGVTDIQPL